MRKTLTATSRASASAIEVAVQAGENHGRNLRHDFVVLSLAHEKLGPSGSQKVQPAERSSQSAINGSRTAVAAWITKAGEITPVQAVGGWLPAASGADK
jgi:hypothetical protein